MSALSVALTLSASVTASQLDGPARPDGEQPRPKIGPMPRAKSLAGKGSFFELVQNPAVVSELKVTPDQLKAIRDGSEGSIEQITALRREFVYARSKGLAGKASEADQAIATIVRAREVAVRRALKPSQWTRLSQIVVQEEHFRSILRPEIRERLGLSDEQNEHVEGLNATYKAELARLREAQRLSVRPDALQRKEAISRKIVEAGSTTALSEEDRKFLDQQSVVEQRGAETIRKHERSFDRELSQSLTRGQRATLEKLAGKPFDFEPPAEKQPAEGGSTKEGEKAGPTPARPG